MPVPYCFCNGIFNHTSLCEVHQGKLLIQLTIPFEEKPKPNLPGDNLRYYRQRKQMTTRQLAEKWVQHMNGLKAQAEEIVNAELIFC